MNRRSFLRSGAVACAAMRVAQGASRPPNIVLIYADDLGYGDLSCYGSAIRTPHLDGMAREGIRLRSFYSASPVCTGSRAALLTGRYAARSGLTGVLFPSDNRGIPPTETTMAEMLKSAGYRTGCIGKWHLGGKPGFLPNDKGFDEFFGVLWSHDMYPLPLMRNRESIANGPDARLLTQYFTQEAVRFIESSGEQPFFLYLPHTAPHIPLASSPGFQGKSGHGAYGDMVQELDWSVGEVLRTLRERGLDDNTMVVFSSDNGPWYQGSAGTLRGRKGETREGGMRVPFIARFPGRIPPRRVSRDMATTMDLLPTFAALAGVPLPGSRPDGVNIWPQLSGDGEAPERPPFLYMEGLHVQCVRSGSWKLHVARSNATPWDPPPASGRMNLPLKRSELYDVRNDPEEAYNVASDYPDVVRELQTAIGQQIDSLPVSVRTAWNDTQRLRVQDTPAAAVPLLDQ